MLQSGLDGVELWEEWAPFLFLFEFEFLENLRFSFIEESLDDFYEFSARRISMMPGIWGLFSQKLQVLTHFAMDQ